jgi:cold shock CspA family protein
MGTAMVDERAAGNYPKKKLGKKDIGPEQTGTLAVTYPNGFGFIKVDDGGRDVFVRSVEVPEGYWRLGARLRFETTPPVKGQSRCAINVRTAPTELPQRQVAGKPKEARK